MQSFVFKEKTKGFSLPSGLARNTSFQKQLLKSSRANDRIKISKFTIFVAYSKKC
jgi:hypothetical protein